MKKPKLKCRDCLLLEKRETGFHCTLKECRVNNTDKACDEIIAEVTNEKI